MTYGGEDTAGREPIEIEDVTVIKASDRALLIKTEDGREVWIPKSQTLEGTEVGAEGDVGAIVIPAWLAGRAGLA